MKTIRLIILQKNTNIASQKRPLNILRKLYVVMWTFKRLICVPLVSAHTIKSMGKSSHGHKVKCTGWIRSLIQNSYSLLPIWFRTYRLACKGGNAASTRRKQHTSCHWHVVIGACRQCMHVVRACSILRCYYADQKKCIQSMLPA